MVIHADFLIFMFLTAFLAKYIEEMVVVRIISITFAFFGFVGLTTMTIDTKKIN